MHPCLPSSTGDYNVPVIPGSVIVNTGGAYALRTVFRDFASCDTLLIPEVRLGSDAVFLPKMEGDLVPFGKTLRITGAGLKPVATEVQARVANIEPYGTRRWW